MGLWSYRYWKRRTLAQARAEVEAITLEALADVEVMNPTRAKIEMALTQFRGVGSDWANAERAPDKTVQRVRGCTFIIDDLLDPAFDEADAQAVLESFDREHFQVGQDAVLKIGGGILCVEFHLRSLGC